MKINWKRVVLAAIGLVLLWNALSLLEWSILPLIFVYFGGPHGIHIISDSLTRFLLPLETWISFFLGGLWVARRIESRFILHGLLVGIFANVLFYIFYLLIFLFLPMHRPVYFPLPALSISYFVFTALKIVAAMVGAYVGGKWRTTPQTEQLGALLR